MTLTRCGTWSDQRQNTTFVPTAPGAKLGTMMPDTPSAKSRRAIVQLAGVFLRSPCLPKAPNAKLRSQVAHQPQFGQKALPRIQSRENPLPPGPAARTFVATTRNRRRACPAVSYRALACISLASCRFAFRKFPDPPSRQRSATASSPEQRCSLYRVRHTGETLRSPTGATYSPSRSRQLPIARLSNKRIHCRVPIGFSSRSIGS